MEGGITLVMIAFFAVIPSMILAKEYVVGDDQGWNGGVDYQKWADTKTFFVGDVLVFNYNPDDYIVAQAANYAAFKNCVSDDFYPVYSSGYDALSFPGPGAYYFLCFLHCDTSYPQELQQKFSVIVV